MPALSNKLNFIEKYGALKKSIPVPAVSIGIRTENCQFVDYTYQSKNCAYCFDCFQLENSLYSTKSYGKNLVDCHSCLESELCYQSVDCNRCYHSTYLQDCNHCRDCHFCALCLGCTDCFGCVGLTHKKYCLFNKQYSEAEYRKRLKKLKKEKPEKILARVSALKQKIPHPQSQQDNTINCPYGDYIYNSKDSYWCFLTLKLEDCGYVFEGGIAKDCWDLYFAGLDSELCYQMVDGSRCYHCAYIENSSDCTNCYYSSRLSNCSDCFGCVGLKNKRFCILNNQLTGEEYKRAVVEIKKELGWK